MLKPLFMDEKIDLKLSDSLMVIEVVMKVMFRLIFNKLNSTMSKNFINITHLRFTTTLWDVNTLLSLFYRWGNRITDGRTQW